MALTQRLEFRQSQSLVMTPQLMQAIKLLQLSNLDLSAFVEEELERNPLLERASDGTEPPVAGEPAPERAGTEHLRACSKDAIGELAVRGDHHDRPRIRVPLHPSRDLVICGVRPGARREGDIDGFLAQVERPPVEHNG